MRSLSATLTANSLSPLSFTRPPLLKLVLTRSGQTTRTYSLSSTNFLLGVNHIEQEWSQIAHIGVQSDSTLAALDLRGYLGTVSYGYRTPRSVWVASTAYNLGDYIIPTASNGYQYKCTTAGTSGTTEPTWGTTPGGTTADNGTLVWTLDGNDGDDFSACAPLEVVAQKTDTLLLRSQVPLITGFTLVGIFDLMGAEKAKEKYTQTDTDSKTIKTLLTSIAEATLAPFTNCKAFTITFDSEDSLIDSYTPGDYFYVAFSETRLSAFKKLLRTTKCKARIEADGAIHVFDPDDGVTHYISGTTYNSEYNDAVTNHNFFEKSTRRRLVIPNRVIVSSHPDHTPPYTGMAYDSDTYTALGDRYIDDPHYIRATNNAQCRDIARAMLQHRQVGAEKGHGLAPMNCGQEVMDYIKITDSIAGDSRVGNIGYLRRQYTPGKILNFEFRFGKVAGEMPFMMRAGGGVAGEAREQVIPQWAFDMQDWVYDELEDMYEWVLEQQEVMAKLHVTNQLIIPVVV